MCFWPYFKNFLFKLISGLKLSSAIIWRLSNFYVGFSIDYLLTDLGTIFFAQVLVKSIKFLSEQQLKLIRVLFF